MEIADKHVYLQLQSTPSNKLANFVLSTSVLIPFTYRTTLNYMDLFLRTGFPQPFLNINELVSRIPTKTNPRSNLN